MTGASSLRIAVVSPYDLSAAGGITNQIRAQARALRKMGHAVEIFGAASGAVEPGERRLGRTVRVTFGGTESGLGLDPRGVAAIARAMRRRFDIVHVHEPLVPLVPWLAVLRAGAPVVGTFHVHREQGHGFYRAWRWALGPIARRLRARIAVSEAARRTVAAHFPGRYEIVPNGIEGSFFGSARPRPPELATTDRHVLYIGRLEPRKGIDHLVRAVARASRSTSDVRLTIAGEGGARDALARLAVAVGAPVRFVGRIPDAALPAYLQAADVVCAPAVGGESFGIVLLEAMAAGTPVIASRIEGYEALARGPEAAVLVPPGDESALAGAIVSLLESPDARRTLVDRGRALARDHDWCTLAPRLVEIYRRAITGA
jgi:phosphatidyl-myo-inositol alpha-mannosyltransferase